MSPIAKFIALAFVAQPLCTATVAQRVANVYVSVTGNDSHAGTQGQPIRSFQKLQTLKLLPGSTIFLKAGDLFKESLILSLHGTPGKPIKIRPYGHGNAQIYAGSREGVVLHGSFFELSGIAVRGAGRKSGNTTNGIRIIESNDCIVRNVTVSGFQKSGLEVFNCRNARVRNVKATDNGFCGIYIIGATREQSENISVIDSRAENNPGDPTNTENHSGNGILVGLSRNVTVDHCVATNNGWDMPRTGNGPVGIWAYESDQVIIQYCISYRNKTSRGGKDGGGFDLDGGVSNSIIQYCLSYENEGAGHGLFQYAGASPWYNNTVRYCISINDAARTEGSGSFFIWNNSGDSNQLRDAFIYNNVVYTKNAPAVRFEAQSDNTRFLFVNNIFSATDTLIDGPSSGERFRGNVWWNFANTFRFRDFTSLADWAAATGQEMLNGEMAGRQMNPQLNGPLETRLTDPYQLASLTGFRLGNNSPLINHGVSLDMFLKELPLKDFFGTPLPQGPLPEPGVYEWNETPAKKKSKSH